MREEHIKIEWVKNGKTHEREVDRKEFYDVMNGIRKEYWDDNYHSTYFCNCIEDLRAIHINMDINKWIETPYVVCEIKDKKEMRKIIRHHKIIWAKLEGYCEEETEKSGK